MIHYAALGIFFKAISWPISYIFIAKGHTRLFFFSELIANLYFLLLNIIGYTYGGLDGLGISFIVNFFLYFVQVFVIAKVKYDFFYNKEFFKIFTIQFITGILCFINVKLLVSPLVYIIGSIMIIFSVIYSLKELNKRMDLKSLLTERFVKNDR